MKDETEILLTKCPNCGNNENIKIITETKSTKNDIFNALLIIAILIILAIITFFFSRPLSTQLLRTDYTITQLLFTSEQELILEFALDLKQMQFLLFAKRTMEILIKTLLGLISIKTLRPYKTQSNIKGICPNCNAYYNIKK